MAEVTREDWNRDYKIIIAQANQYNTWRRKAQKALLHNIAPRLAKLNQSHIEERFGKLITALSKEWQPHSNNLKAITDDAVTALVNKFLVKAMIADIIRYERTIGHS